VGGQVYYYISCTFGILISTGGSAKIPFKKIGRKAVMKLAPHRESSKGNVFVGLFFSVHFVEGYFCETPCITPALCFKEREGKVSPHKLTKLIVGPCLRPNYSSLRVFLWCTRYFRGEILSSRGRVYVLRVISNTLPRILCESH
jgi:hypothetical protein